VLIFVLGLLLGSSNPAKEEERDFLTQTSPIVRVFSNPKVFSSPKVFSNPKVFSGLKVFSGPEVFPDQHHQTYFERGNGEETSWLFLLSFYSLVKNTLVYHYHPACGLATKGCLFSCWVFWLNSLNPAEKEERDRVF
jgi:hypothetical protein